MLISSMSSPCVGVSPNDIPTLDRQSDSYENVSLYGEKDAKEEVPPVLTRAPILCIPNADGVNHAVTNSVDRKQVYPQVNSKKSFALEALINRAPSCNQNTTSMRKRHMFRIDDILARMCASKEQKLDVDNEIHSNPTVISTNIDNEPIKPPSPKTEEIIHPPSPSDVSAVNNEAVHSDTSEAVSLLMVADPPSLSEIYPSKTTEKPYQDDGNENVDEMDVLPCLESIENRPATPLTPSLDPDFLRRLEEEDMPKRVLRSSTIARTEDSKNSAAKRTAQNKTASKRNATSTPRKHSSQTRARQLKKTPKKEVELSSTGVHYEPIEVSINDDANGLCAPSSSGLSSISSASSCGSQRSRRRKRRRTKIVVSNWKPVCSGSRQHVYFNNDALPTKRVCYKAVRHVREPETLRVRDSVVVKALDGTCNYGKVTRIFLDDNTGNLMASVLWYYNAEQIETDPATVSPPIADKELFASRHIDVVPLDTIEEIIFVITFNEFARYMAENKIDALPRAQRPREEDEVWSRGENGYPRRTLLPCEDTPVELVYFCRRLYDFKQKKITTNKPITSRKLLAARRSTHRTSY
uniref:BAH domain-containing protein n=2 Tax=Parascaris TaxID=6254 RepID=A0A915BT73_PARUN